MATDATQPTVKTIDLKLVVVQAPMRVDRDFMEDMRFLWRKLAARLDSIPHVSEPRRQIGHWHWVDSVTRLYVMGVQVDTLKEFRWDYAYGLGAWAPGEVTFAMYRERNGEEGTVVKRAYGELAEAGYGHDPRFMGEFEVWPLDSIGPDGQKPEGECHEVWIPVVEEKA